MSQAKHAPSISVLCQSVEKQLIDFVKANPSSVGGTMDDLHVRLKEARKIGYGHCIQFLSDLYRPVDPTEFVNIGFEKC